MFPITVVGILSDLVPFDTIESAGVSVVRRAILRRLAAGADVSTLSFFGTPHHSD